ncbi:hypothetical protein JCM8547_001103 [Rhodosporidiobolus lusitaniae]
MLSILSSSSLVEQIPDEIAAILDELDEHAIEQLGEWLYDEKELAGEFLKQYRPLHRSHGSSSRKQGATAEIQEILKQYNDVCRERAQARHDGGPLGGKVARELRKMDDKERDEKQIRVRVIQLRGPEAAVEQLQKDLHYFTGTLTAQYTEMSSLMRKFRYEALTGGDSQPAKIARLEYQLLASKTSGKQIGETLDSIYQHITYLNGQQVALPSSAVLFLRGEAVPVSPTPPFTTTPSSSASSSSSSSATSAPPERRRPPPKNDRLARLRRGLNSLAVLSPRKRAIYEGRVELW